MNTRLLGSGGVVVLWLFLSAASADEAVKPGGKKDRGRPSNKKLDQLVNELLTPWMAGDHGTTIKALRSQIGRAKDAQLADLNEALQSRGAPTMAGILMETHLRMVRVGIRDSLNDAGVKERVLLIQEIDDQIGKRFETVRAIELMRDPLPDPEDFLAYRNMLWEAHVHNNQLQEAVELARFGTMVSGTVTKLNAKVPQSDRDVLATDFSNHTRSAADLRQELLERGVELRLARISFALDRLQQRSTDMRSRFFAAYAVGADGASLESWLKDHAQHASRELLQDPDLLVNLQKSLQEGRQVAGEMVHKAELLFEGLHWWRRGRYGAGPDGEGLLKSVAALDRPAARLPLYMPEASPVPTDPFATNPIAWSPRFDRRHHYVWAWQDRDFFLSQASSSASVSTPVQGTGSTQIVRAGRGMVDGSTRFGSSEFFW